MGIRVIAHLAEKTVISASLSMRPVSSSSSAPVVDEARRVNRAIFDSYVYSARIWS
jgi:hypothetical protein